MAQGYCMKCRKKVDMKSPKVVTKGKRKMTRGVCPKCGTTVVRFGK